MKPQSYYDDPQIWGLCVDGTMPDETLQGEPDAVSPFYVFDIAAQDWIAGPFDGLRDAVKAGRMIARSQGRVLTVIPTGATE